MPASPATVNLGELAAQLRHGVGRLARRLRREGSAPGASQPQLSALTTIERHSTMTMGALAAHEQVQPPTMTAIVASLLAEGLVTRTPDPLDRRIAWLVVTPEGRKLLSRRRRNMDAFLVGRLRALPPEDVATLERAADIIADLTEEPR
ncbi:MAG: MarR family transcriptional regulator [Actinomycetota bacterium]|jgi:DNA-binding MarR family transcriptional regulator|nr:MarR family transcriptional regulator [Actinomycetota bacterium]